MYRPAFILKRMRSLLKEGGVGLLIRKIFLKLVRLFSPRTADMLEKKIQFYKKHKYWPHLSNPRSFSEHLMRRIRINPHPLSSTVADKIKVRDYVSEKVGKDILNELLWVGNSPEDIPFENLPEKFVIKANHGSGWNIIVNNKYELDKKQVIEKCTKWLSTKYSNYWGEAYYEEIQPLIMIEKFLEDSDYTIPLDYKFFCFHGSPEHVGVDINRFKNHKRIFYDKNWNKLPYTFKYPNPEREVAKPENFQKMIEIAEKLSEDFDFCRVDLYCPNDQKIYFGEITLTPGAAQDPIKPVDWDFKLGALWSIQKNRNFFDLGVSGND